MWHSCPWKCSFLKARLFIERTSMARGGMYQKSVMAGWGDMDFNSHMRNTAYLDKSGDVRMMYFSEHGFPMSEFMRLKIGPVVMKDEIEYFREVHLLEAVNVELAVIGLAEDGSRMMFQNRFLRSDG